MSIIYDSRNVEKLTLRILGCLVGAASGIAAIVYLIPSITSIGALMVIVFLGALASAWIAAGSPRIAHQPALRPRLARCLPDH